MHLSIKQSLITATLILVAIITFFIGRDMIASVTKRSIAVEIARTDKNVTLAMNASNAVGDERATTYIALLNPNNSKEILDNITSLRTKTDEAYALLLAAAEAESFVDKDKMLGDIKTATADLLELRKVVDRTIVEPVAQRDASFEKQWLKSLNTLVMAIQDMRIKLSRAAMDLDGAYEMKMLNRHFAWLYSEYLQRERARLTALISAGRSIDNEQNTVLTENRARVEEAANFIKKMAHDASVETEAARSKMMDIFFGDYTNLRKKIFEAGLDGRVYPLSAVEYYKEASIAVDAALAFRTQLRAESDAYAKDKKDTATRNILFKMLLSLFCMAVATATLWIVLRQVTTPISTITSRMRLLADGALETEVPYTELKNEVGVMAAALQTFKENLIKNREMEAREAEERKVRERRAELISSLTTGFDKDASSVIHAVSGATTELNATAQSMSATAEETNVQAGAVATAANEMSTNVQTVAAAAEELSTSIAEINRQVAVSARMANEAVTVASDTNQQVQGLAEASAKIGEVVSLINDIAAQTNLLALNATIEAARAGDAGKGFAVVASEVKSLANQTAKATEHISEQIKTVQSATVEAVAAIKGIVTKITEISSTSSSIAAAVEEQGAATQEILRNVQQAATGTGEVSSNIEGVSQAAQITGSAASEVLAATNELSRQSETMRQKVEKFLKDVRAA